ncbi:MAG: MBL fold metallo-hydrolase [Desulfobacteraceae bacterium]|nr:MBL fold metallo-hydrolase [Desulfobacteraceae bacterium]
MAGQYSENIKEIFEDFFFIQRGFLNGNHFVYRGDPPILIDTGYLGDLEETASLITGLDVDLAHTSLIINTHCHCDHIGANRYIQDISGCETALHHIGKHFIDTRDAWSTWSRYYNQEAEFFRATYGLEDGETLDIGPYRFEVLYTPGHSADGIVLYNRRQKILLSSDALWENDVAVITERVEGSRALFSLIESIKRLQDLDVRMVYPGHGRPFNDFKGALEKSLDKIRKYLWDREKLGDDQLKKILVYTLLMRRKIREDELFEELMNSHWYPESVDFYFQGEYERKFTQVIGELLGKKVIYKKRDLLYPAVRA